MHYRFVIQASVIRTYNGSELISIEFECWYKEYENEFLFFQQFRFVQNGYIERFNRVYRESFLDAYLFTEIRNVRALPEE